jgi:predicted HTH domain antitoxin
MKKVVKVEVTDHALRLFNGDEVRFGHEMIEAAVVRWFEEGLLSQGQSSELLGISRRQFLDVLYKHKASPVNITREELEEDFRNHKV